MWEHSPPWIQCGSTPPIPPQSQLLQTHIMDRVCLEDSSLVLVTVGLVLLLALFIILCYRTLKSCKNVSVPIV